MELNTFTPHLKTPKGMTVKEVWLPETDQIKVTFTVNGEWKGEVITGWVSEVNEYELARFQRFIKSLNV